MHMHRFTTVHVLNLDPLHILLVLCRYARTVLDCATASPDGRGRALLIGGGIANFTDVAATFQVRSD